MENVKPMVMVIFPPNIKEMFKVDVPPHLPPPHENPALRAKLMKGRKLAETYSTTGEPVLEIRCTEVLPLERHYVLREVKDIHGGFGYTLTPLPKKPAAS